MSKIKSPPDDRVLHTQVRTGSGVIFVGPGMEPFGTHGTPDPDCVASMTYVYVDAVDGNRQYTASDPGGQCSTFAQPAEKPADGG